jgi:hypothetical protein
MYPIALIISLLDRKAIIRMIFVFAELFLLVEYGHLLQCQLYCDMHFVRYKFSNLRNSSLFSVKTNSFSDCFLFPMAPCTCISAGDSQPPIQVNQYVSLSPDLILAYPVRGSYCVGACLPTHLAVSSQDIANQNNQLLETNGNKSWICLSEIKTSSCPAPPATAK